MLYLLHVEFLQVKLREERQSKDHSGTWASNWESWAESRITYQLSYFPEYLNSDIFKEGIEFSDLFTNFQYMKTKYSKYFPFIYILAQKKTKTFFFFVITGTSLLHANFLGGGGGVGCGVWEKTTQHCDGDGLNLGLASGNVGTSPGELSC